MIYWWWIIPAFMVGGLMGVFVMGLLSMNARDERDV